MNGRRCGIKVMNMFVRVKENCCKVEMGTKRFVILQPNLLAWENSCCMFLSPPHSLEAPLTSQSALLCLPAVWYSTLGRSLGFPAPPLSAASHQAKRQDRNYPCATTEWSVAKGVGAGKPGLLPGLDNHAVGRHGAVHSSWWVEVPVRGLGKECAAVVLLSRSIVPVYYKVI